MMKNLAKDIKEIATLLAISHGSNHKNIALSRNNEILINPSAKSTILAWQSNPTLQYFLFQTCGEGDGSKTAVFILASLILSYVKSPYKDLPTHLINLDAMRCEPSKDDLKLMTKEVLNEELPEIVYDFLLGDSNAHISIELGENTSFEVLHSESFIAKTTYSGYTEDKNVKGAMIAFFSYPLLTLEDIKECLENQIEGRPVVLIAPLILGEALKTINLNRNKKIIECYAVECPKIFDQGSWLEDLASFTGGKIVTRLKKFDYQEDFGSALEICFKEKEMLVEQYEDHIESTVKRIDQLQYELTQESIFYKAEQIQQRISNLQGSLLRVKVGGVTQLEAKHRRAICEKLIISLVQAVRSGILKDGLILSLSRIETGNEVLDKALRSSLEIVKKNSGMVVDERKLKIPFPKSRAVEIISNAVSIGVLLTSVEMVVDKKKQ